MELEIKLMLLKFFLSLITMLVVSNLGSDGLVDMLAPPEEREQRQEALDVLNKLRTRFPLLAAVNLNSHETMVASALVEPNSKRGFDSIGGHNNIKRELKLHVVVPLRNPSIFFKFDSLKPPCGILFAGPPGTGKTMLAQSVASECDVPFLSIKSSLVEQKYFGESEKIVKAIFSFAAKISPCIIFIDEIDSMLRNRSDFEQSATYSVKTQFLQEIDRIDNENLKIVVIAATNNPMSLDKALYRRLPRVYEVGLPDLQARKEILINLTKNQSIKDKDLEWVAKNTENFSGSNLKDLYKAAAAVRNETFSQLLLSNGSVNVSPAAIGVQHWKKALTNKRLQ
jgi:SpoVK/Ycf46/Vps4 family AAA+-type ATPase